MSNILYEVNDGIALIQFDRPQKLNALTLAMYDDLDQAFLRAGADDSVRVIVLTGSGDRAFCVGADLTESIPALTEGRFDISRWDGAHLKNSKVYKPIICAVNGLCMGGGFEIMLATDIRIAAADATFALPEPSIGLVPAGGTLVRLTRQIPYAHAMELLLTADRFSAARLAQMGVINHVVPRESLMATAFEFANRIKRLSASALEVIKESVATLPDMPIGQAFAAEAILGQRAFASADAKKGLAAFAAGGKAEF